MSTDPSFFALKREGMIYDFTKSTQHVFRVVPGEYALSLYWFDYSSAQGKTFNIRPIPDTFAIEATAGKVNYIGDIEVIVPKKPFKAFGALETNIFGEKMLISDPQKANIQVHRDRTAIETYLKEFKGISAPVVSSKIYPKVLELE